jgi:hypothetical protein
MGTPTEFDSYHDDSEENETFKLISVIPPAPTERDPVLPDTLYQLYEDAAETLMASSPWALIAVEAQEEEDPFPPIPLLDPLPPIPLLRPSSHPPAIEYHAKRTAREQRRKRAAAIAAFIVAPFLVLAAYALVAAIAA